MTSDASGLSFSNQLNPGHSLTNTIVNNGSGVALGDIDADGRVDIFLCGLDVPNRLYRNLGNWRFEDITAAAGLAEGPSLSTGAVLVDVDGDGRLDLLVNSIGTGTRLYRNRGVGRFEVDRQAGLRASGGSTSMALADTDGDGDLDLYVANYRTSTIIDQPGVRFTLSKVEGRLVVSRVNGVPTDSPEMRDRFVVGPNGNPREAGEADVFYLNDGKGHFSEVGWTGGTFLESDGKPLTSAPLDWGLTATFRDLNQDGWPDLYVCNDADSPDRVWINDRSGHFRALPATALRHTPLSSMGLDVADVNRDGLDDMFVVDMLARRHEERLTFLEKSQRPEMVLSQVDARPQFARNTLQLQRDDHTYADVALLAGLGATDWAWSPVFLDVDLDGYEDLLVANGFHRAVEDIDVADRIRQLKSERRLSPKEELELRALFPKWETPNLAFRNQGDLHFEEIGRDWGFDTPGVSQGMALADLDNDGDLDVVINNLDGATGLYRNETVAPRLAVRLKGLAPNTRGIGARITVRGGAVPIQTQEMQAGGRYLSSDDALRVFAAGPGDRRLSVEVRWRNGRISEIRDVAPNQVCEVDESGAGEAPMIKRLVPEVWFEEVEVTGATHRDEPFDDHARQPLVPRPLSQLGPGVAWCDLNGDGWDDLLMGAGRGGRPGLWLNDGKGAFRGVNFGKPAAGTPDDITGIVAWNAEPGHSTVLTGLANYESGRTNTAAVLRHELFFGNVDTAPAVPGGLSSTGPIAVADIDGDGDLDLFVGGRVQGGRFPAPAASRLYRNVDGRFVEHEDTRMLFDGVGLVSGAVWTDLDGDGFPELVLALEWGPLRIFHNEHGHMRLVDTRVELGSGAGSRKLSELTGGWTGVTCGDFDGDGRLDLVASNWGRNTRYEEFLSRGIRMRHGDIDGNGTWDVIESHWEEEMKAEVPFRDLRSMRSAIPEVGERFKSHREYARASLAGIFGKPLESLPVLEIRVLDSALFLNRGDHWEFRPLPGEVQWAPGQGLCVADANGDGHEDLFLAQNCFASSEEGAREDAGRGLWLRGDGRGGLAVVPSNESGVRLYGDQRAAAVSDFNGDGRPDLVVTQNGAALRLLRNRAAKPGLRVRLAGPPGNASGIGAWVRVGSNASWGVWREVHGGGGYWSQDSVVPVLAAPGGAEISRVEVRWPGGKLISGEVPAGSVEVEVGASGQIQKTR